MQFRNLIIWTSFDIWFIHCRPISLCNVAPNKICVNDTFSTKKVAGFIVAVNLLVEETRIPAKKKATSDTHKLYHLSFFLVNLNTMRIQTHDFSGDRH